MAWQQSDLDTVRAAISSGVQRVKYADGREVMYQSLDHLVAAERVIDAALQMQGVSAGALVRRRVPYYRSGL